MLLINVKEVILNHLRWKYFMGEFKPGELVKLEKYFKAAPSFEKPDLREFRILLDVIKNNSSLKAELGLNAYELYSTGDDDFLNFKDPSNVIMYKVHDLSNTNTLFETADKGLSIDAIKKGIATDLPADKAYIKNFAKGYIMYALSKDIDYTKLNIESDYKDLGFKSVSYDKDNYVLIIEAN